MKKQLSPDQFMPRGVYSSTTIELDLSSINNLLYTELGGYFFDITSLSYILKARYSRVITNVILGDNPFYELLPKK